MRKLVREARRCGGLYRHSRPRRGCSCSPRLTPGTDLRSSNHPSAPESPSGAELFLVKGRPMPAAPLSLSSRSSRTTDSPISYYIQKALDTPGLISLAAGLVDEPSLPAAEVAAAVADI